MAQQDRRREQSREQPTQHRQESTAMQRAGGDRRFGLAPWRAESPLVRMLSEMDWMFDQMQRGFFGAAGRFSPDLRLPNFEIDETRDAIVLNAEIPGVDAKDLQLEYRDGVLTIRAESQQEEDEDTRTRFRRYASFYRQVSLPPDADVDRAQASVKNGVLTIRFPRHEDSENVKRIPITREGQREAA